MRGVVTIAMLGLLGGMVLAGPAPGLAASSGSELRAKKACGKTDVGHTRASVRARNVKCSTARKVVRRFVHKYPGREAEECILRLCRVKHRFFCGFDGRPGIAILRCSNPSRNNADLRARWGD